MRINHVAIWCRDLESMRDFYVKYFGATCGDKYENSKNSFTSYFLKFDSGCRMELMHLETQESEEGARSPTAIGYTHIAVSVDSEGNVDQLTKDLEASGHKIVGAPRRTGDGYYESVVLDPEGNRIEITV